MFVRPTVVRTRRGDRPLSGDRDIAVACPIAFFNQPERHGAIIRLPRVF